MYTFWELVHWRIFFQFIGAVFAEDGEVTGEGGRIAGDVDDS